MSMACTDWAYRQFTTAPIPSVYPNDVKLPCNNIIYTLLGPSGCIICGTVYKKSAILIVRAEDEYPVFGEVSNVYIYEEQVLFKVCIFHTASYDPHFHAYELSRTLEVCYVKYDDLLSYIPLHLKKSPNNTKSLVILKHKLIL